MGVTLYPGPQRRISNGTGLLVPGTGGCEGSAIVDLLEYVSEGGRQAIGVAPAERQRWADLQRSGGGTGGADQDATLAQAVDDLPGQRRVAISRARIDEIGGEEQRTSRMAG